MTDNHTDRKLQLIQQIRSRYNENQYDMYNRERILYGKTTTPLPAQNKYGTGMEADNPDGESMPSSFRVRLLLAVLLFAGVVAMDVNRLNISGVTSETIVEAISMDYEEKIDEWMTALSE